MGLDREEKLVRCIKPAEIIDMAIRVIALNPPGQPKDTVNPEHTVNLGVDFFARPIRVAIGIKENRLGGEEQSGAIGLNRAPFQNERAAQATQPSDSATQAGTASSRFQGGNFPPQAL